MVRPLEKANSPVDGEVIIRTRGLTKRFGRIIAVKDLALEVHRGEVFGFLGPNGAGKTTTIGMLLGLIQPTAGTIELFGHDIREDLPAALRRVGAVVENPSFYPYLSGRDNLRLFAQLQGGVSQQKIAELLKLVELSARAGDQYRTYSQGMKQRLGIACTLLKDPELVILDEPTNGLDPAGMKEIRELILRLAAQGKTIFLCSHLLHEVEQVCGRVAIIKEGETIAQGSVQELLRRGQVLQVRVTDPDRAAAILREVSWIASVEREGELLLVEAPTERAAEVSALLAKNGLYVAEIKSQERTLESFFLEITGGEHHG